MQAHIPGRQDRSLPGPPTQGLGHSSRCTASSPAPQPARTEAAEGEDNTLPTCSSWVIIIILSSCSPARGSWDSKGTGPNTEEPDHPLQCREVKSQASFHHA